MAHGDDLMCIDRDGLCTRKAAFLIVAVLPHPETNEPAMVAVPCCAVHADEMGRFCRDSSPLQESYKYTIDALPTIQEAAMREFGDLLVGV
jgi:hypothetical protein